MRVIRQPLLRFAKQSNNRSSFETVRRSSVVVPWVASVLRVARFAQALGTSIEDRPGIIELDIIEIEISEISWLDGLHDTPWRVRG